MPSIYLSRIWRSIRVLITAAGIAVAALPSDSACAADAVARGVIGKWRLTAALDASDVVSIDEKQARRLVGKVFTISRTKVVFGDRDCGEPELESELVETGTYLRDQAHASAKKLGLPNPVTVVDVACTVVFVKKPDRLVIHWDGWFFDAVRVR
jgi:hypothetical protein